MTTVLRINAWIAGALAVGVDPRDDDQIRWQKKAMVASAWCGFAVIALWSALYLSFGERVAAGILSMQGLLSAASLAGFAHQTLSVTVITMASDLFRRSEVATVAGMAGFFGNFGLLVFNLLIGGLVASVGYTPFFVVLGVLDLLGAVVLWTVVREPVAGRRGGPVVDLEVLT
jgi:hypothetical protein